MLFCHGNAHIESGFSVNSDFITENMSQTSVVAQRQVYDRINALDSIENVEIT